MKTASLAYLARGRGTYSKRQLHSVDRWLKDDWEASDHDRELLTVVARLVSTALYQEDLLRIRQDHLEHYRQKYYALARDENDRKIKSDISRAKQRRT